MTSCPNPIEVATSWGVLVEHVDGLRRVRQLDPVVAADLVRYLGGDPEEARQDVAAPMLTVRGDELVAFSDNGELVLANGQMVAVSPDVPTSVPVGYHRFYPTGSTAPMTVVGDPAVAAPAPSRGWGLSVQPYALRSSQDWGIGDLGTVRDLARWAAREGATTLSLGPMLAAAPTTPREPSPYYPATRLFLDPLYLSMQDVRAPDGTPVAVSRPAGLSDSAEAPIDRDAVHAAKYSTLRALWSSLDGSPDLLLQDFLAASALPVRLFATWCVLADKLGGDWRQWPTELQDPGSTQVEAFAERHAHDVSFHVWSAVDV
ncbi:4-alpha-glucanotransferase [Brachybacterium sp. GPGPB12]|uniref:4-alpha-glucanotransferase n=1 Tax=Brachybacterium sp. GPGPB12 TaxID=3023517 RepID=UPI0031345B85